MSTLVFRAKLTPGENVLILGATGVAGKLAVKIAKLLGARRIVAAGRNEQVLNTLHKHGADAVIRLDKPPEELSDAFANEVGNAAFQVVIDYGWGRPTEAFLAAITRQGICRCHIRDSPGASWRERRGDISATRYLKQSERSQKSKGGPGRPPSAVRPCSRERGYW
jgi:NADPH:quinone reductase-like Zn-dependent oxidoreductase